METLAASGVSSVTHQSNILNTAASAVFSHGRYLNLASQRDPFSQVAEQTVSIIFLSNPSPSFFYPDALQPPLLPPSVSGTIMKLVAAVTFLANMANAFAIPCQVPELEANDITSLVPEFGVVAGTDPDVLQAGSCSGFNGQSKIPIPCSCPPDRDEFISKLKEALIDGNVFGDPIAFSSDAADQSPDTNRERATACIILLQSFNGQKGDGCPGAAAPNFVSQQRSGVVSNAVAVG